MVFLSGLRPTKMCLPSNADNEGPDQPAHLRRIIGYFRMYERRAKAWMILSACTGWSESVHFAHVRKHVFAWHCPSDPSMNLWFNKFSFQRTYRQFIHDTELAMFKKELLNTSTNHLYAHYTVISELNQWQYFHSIKCIWAWQKGPYNILQCFEQYMFLSY